MDFREKTVLVTGAGSGIDRATGRRAWCCEPRGRLALVEMDPRLEAVVAAACR